MSETVAGRYEIERPLGHGAMAVVDRAHDRELGRDVALKRLAENLARDPDLRERFLREGRLAARLSHPLPPLPGVSNSPQTDQGRVS